MIRFVIQWYFYEDYMQYYLPWFIAYLIWTVWVDLILILAKIWQSINRQICFWYWQSFDRELTDIYWQSIDRVLTDRFGFSFGSVLTVLIDCTGRKEGAREPDSLIASWSLHSGSRSYLSVGAENKRVVSWGSCLIWVVA